MSEPKTILSLFDASGRWSQPFLDAGHNVIHIDLQHEPELHDVGKFCVDYFLETLGIEWVDVILAAPPCTDFTRAGAAYWKQKDLDGRTAASVHLVRQVLRCVEYWKPDFYAIENPLGRLGRLVPELGEPRLRFDPCDYARNTLLDRADAQAARDRLERIRRKPLSRITAGDSRHVLELEAFTKRTQLWGHFNPPRLSRIEPVRVCSQGSPLQRLGGSSAKTKATRSNTPRGFAMAFYLANNWSDRAIKGWGGTSLDRIDAEETDLLTSRHDAP